MEFRDDGRRFCGGYDEEFKVEAPFSTFDTDRLTVSGDLRVVGEILNSATNVKDYTANYSISSRPGADLGFTQPSGTGLNGRFMDSDLLWFSGFDIPSSILTHGLAATGHFAQIHKPGIYTFNISVALQTILALSGPSGCFAVTENWDNSPLGLPLMVSCTDRAPGVHCTTWSCQLVVDDIPEQTFPVNVDIFVLAMGEYPQAFSFPSKMGVLLTPGRTSTTSVWHKFMPVLK